MFSLRFHSTFSTALAVPKNSLPLRGRLRGAATLHLLKKNCSHSLGHPSRWARSVLNMASGKSCLQCLFFFGYFRHERGGQSLPRTHSKLDFSAPEIERERRQKERQSLLLLLLFVARCQHYAGNAAPKSGFSLALPLKIQA